MTCIHCGTEAKVTGYSQDVTNKLIDREACYECNFWLEKIEIPDKRVVAIIDGRHYIIGDEADEFKGFGGDKHTIKFNDGRVVTTTNLWTQGDIPKHFKYALKDNAIFIGGLHG